MDEIYTKAILKLIKLTYKGKIKWEFIREKEVLLESNVYYITEFNNKYFRIYWKRRGIDDGPKLEIITSNRDVEWEFPDHPRLIDLWRTIEKKRKEDVPKILIDLLNKEF